MNTETKLPEVAFHHGPDSVVVVDTSLIPADQHGAYIRYGRELLMNTAYYIGPQGINGKYLGNKMNCSNCHQDAGTKPYSLNLVLTHGRYPQYRAREGKVLSLAERVNNCIERPHCGKPLPLDSKEMVSILAYLQWINTFAPKDKRHVGLQNMTLSFPSEPASPERGGQLFKLHCVSCHGDDGQGVMREDGVTYQYPPLWGKNSYQAGSSMHRTIKLAEWIKTNMPYLQAKWEAPVLTDKDAFDLAAFINDGKLHQRPQPASFDYPSIAEKPIDFPVGPYADTFSELSHQRGPYEPIISYWKENGLRPSY